MDDKRYFTVQKSTNDTVTIRPGVDETAVHLALSEVDAARRKHGRSFERATDERRLRILVEQVGEVARAIEDLHVATRVNAGATAKTRVLAAAREHLLQEVARVAATALMWIAGELEHAGDLKPDNVSEPSER